MVCDLAPHIVISCIPDTVASIPSDQLNSELIVQHLVDQLLIVMAQLLTMTIVSVWRYGPTISRAPFVHCTPLPEQQASIERKDTKIVDASNSAASN